MGRPRHINADDLGWYAVYLQRNNIQFQMMMRELDAEEPSGAEFEQMLIEFIENMDPWSYRKMKATHRQERHRQNRQSDKPA